ncbi:hypothetical protein Q3G72_011437 [Acer saccharum]|nr:hypothetical protein Q3G72_011437 [Acer saccharum]
MLDAKPVSTPLPTDHDLKLLDGTALTDVTKFRQPQFRRWPFRRRPTFSLSSPPSLSPDSRASRQKLEELLQQWSEWQAQHGSSLNRVGDNR